jgi:hypothetical protein
MQIDEHKQNILNHLDRMTRKEYWNRSCRIKQKDVETEEEKVE